MPDNRGLDNRGPTVLCSYTLTCNEAESPSHTENEPEQENTLSNLPGRGEVRSEYPVGDKQLHPLVQHAKTEHHEGPDKVDSHNLVIL